MATTNHAQTGTSSYMFISANVFRKLQLSSYC